MATQSRKTGPELFAGDQSAENVRRRFIDAPMEAAQQSVLSSSLELAKLLSILSGAFLASQQRELERVKMSGKEKDSRIEILQTSIEQTSDLLTTAQRGQARAARALAAMSAKDSVFHGFVSNAEFEPLPGLTIRLVDSGKTGGAGRLTDTTDHDGYFRIALDAKIDVSRESRSKSGQMSISERIANLFATTSKGVSDTSSTDSPADSQGDWQVEILRKDKVIYRDPALVPRDQGSVYREYVIADDKPSSQSKLRDFGADRKHEAQDTPIDTGKPAAETSQAVGTMSSTASEGEAQSASKIVLKKPSGDAGSSKGRAKKSASIRDRKR